ncbi:MAG: type II secretion system ATPase GspE [Thermodesulfobacteriota bacterium]|nr:type II secretion system ATPase GspE [Thermodesulfobacteriota bacterium]
MTLYIETRFGAKMEDINRRLIAYLMEKGLLGKADHERVFPLGETPENFSIAEHLIKPGLINAEGFRAAVKEFFGAPFASADDYPREPVLFDQLSVLFMKESKFLPGKIENNILTVIMSNPFDFYTLEGIRLATNHEINVLVGAEEEVLKAIERTYGAGTTSMEKIIEDIDGIPEYQAEDEENVDHLRDLASEGPVIRLVNLIITRAIEKRASDIHFEPFEENFRVRYRIDGVLHDAESPPKRLQSAIISRIKIMAKLNIAERRLPQDGRIMLRVKGKEIDFRVSSVPTIHGESVVLRILDKSSIVMDVEQLGFQADTLREIQEIVKNPHGIILVTGPTGSGKTTTLYCALQKINSPGKKIITVEDPVEYQLKGINQIQVKPSIGLTFANALRSIVRQDPDVILIGEIRDAETAEIAIHSALTGHLVLSTLHTNDAPSAVTRLIDMGMEDYLLSSTIIGILAQRLVRISCRHCRVPFSPDREILKEMKLEESTLTDWPIHEVKGCEKCNYSGYWGRTGIFEFLKINEEIQKLILEKRDANIIKETARLTGMRTLREDGWLKVKQGITTVSEVLRVTQEEII